MMPPAGVPVIGSLALRGLLRGPRRAARVRGGGPVAAYLEVAPPGPAGPPAVVAVITPGAVRLPNAVVLPPDTDDLTGVCARMTAMVGGHRVELGGRVLDIDRWWDPRVRLAPLRAADLVVAVARLEAELPAWHDDGGWYADRLRAATADLEAALRREAFNAALHAARRLLGVGPGLTPAGDDVLAGTLAGLRVWSQAAGVPVAGALADRLHAALAPSLPTTSALAAALLGHAARGELAEPAAKLCAALGGRGCIDAAVSGLLAVGHTSGHDLARGLLVGARVVGALHGGGARTRAQE